MSDRREVSVKRKARKKGESSPCTTSTKSKKVKRVDKSARGGSKGKASTPARSPSREPSREPCREPSRESSGQSDVKIETKVIKKADPDLIKAIKEGRENFVHIVRRGTKSSTFVFPPGRIYKHGTDPKTVPVVPTAKMKEEMRGMVSRTGRKKSKQRKYHAEKTSNSNTTGDKSSASRKKSRKNRHRKKDTPIPPN